MAADSQGVTLSWDGTIQAEVVSLSIDGVSHGFVEVTGRTYAHRFTQHSPHDIDAGTASVTMRTKGNLSASTFGTPETLRIAYGLVTLLEAQTAYLQSFAWSASVGELQEYRAVFRLSGTVTV